MPHRSSSPSAVLALALLAAPAAAQDSAAAPGSPIEATRPRLGGPPDGPRHALWIPLAPVGLMFRGEAGFAAEFERRISRRLTIGASMEMWDSQERLGPRDRSPSSPSPDFIRSPISNVDYLINDVRLKYYLGDRPMRGAWIAGSVGYARVQGGLSDDAVQSPAPGLSFPAWQRLEGSTVGAQLGYSWLLGDGVRNRLGITTELGVKYLFVDRTDNVRRTLVLPRLRIGFTF